MISPISITGISTIIKIRIGINNDNNNNNCNYWTAVEIGQT